MLSTEMPVHQLSKKGEQEIRIIRRPANGGQVTLYWKVEPNVAVGHPGQLAYRLDTWVIKRRLDQLPRPIPRLIRVGDLRQIARELDLGGDTNAVKRAFEQNTAELNKAAVAAFEEAFKYAPAGSESMVGNLKTAFATAQSAYDNFTAINKQIATSVERNVASAQAVATGAAKSTKGKRAKRK
jgi:hypothetical protein